MNRAAQLGFAVLGFTACVMAFVLPAGAVARELAVGGADWSQAALTERTAALLWRGLWVAACGVALAQLLGAALAAALMRLRSRVARGLLAWLALFTLLTPPYVLAYAWSLPLLPAGLTNAAVLDAPWTGWLASYGRAIIVLGLWLAPAATFILTVGWRTSCRSWVTLGLLDTAPARAFFTIGLPLLCPWLAVSAGLSFLLAATNYTIYQLSLLQTLNTQILADATLAPTAGQAFVRAWPYAVLIALLLLWWRFGGRRMVSELWVAPDQAESLRPPQRRSWRVLTYSLPAAAVLLLPWILLAGGLRDWRAFLHVTDVFPHVCTDSALNAALAGTAAVVLAWWADWLRLTGCWGRGAIYPLLRASVAITLGLAAVYALMPAPLVGDAILAAYVTVRPLRDSIAIVVLTALARFAVFALLLQRLSGAAQNESELHSARVDGADAWAAFWWIRVPCTWQAAAVGGIVVFALTLGEVAALQLVQPPGVGSVAVTLLNRIHFGRNDDVIALCGYVGGAVGVVSAAVMVIRARLRAA